MIRALEKVRRLDGVDCGAENPVRMIAQLAECGRQCSFVGSDQPERPVIALNLRSSPAYHLLGVVLRAELLELGR